MASLPVLSILEKSNVSPPPAATVRDTSLPMTFMDITHIPLPPVHFVLFYQLPITRTKFTETIVPKLKHSLSITLQHFLPFAGNMIVYPSSTDLMPEIRYVEGDSVKVTSAECNLDFDDLTRYHPRNCDKFYHLLPPLGDFSKTSDYLKIPVFSLQVTFFPNCGFSVGVTYSHTVADGISQFCFLNAWTSIAQRGTDELFLADGTLPFYERVVNYPERDKSILVRANVETLFGKEYQPPKLPVPNDKVRATFILTRTVIDQLKKLVSTQLPTLLYVTSFTVTCAYIWSCIAKTYCNEDERQGFIITADARRRLNPPIPASYFGNCTAGSLTIAQSTLLTGYEGFIAAAKLIGENLHKFLTGNDGILSNKPPEGVKEGWPKTLILVYGSPKLRYYDLDFGWGKPKKFEIVSMDYGFASGALVIPIDGGKEFNQDMEFSICLTASQMETFATAFNKGLEIYI